MADGTRFKLLENALQEVKDEMAKLSARLGEVVTTVGETDGRLQRIEEQPPPPPPHQVQPRINLKFPKFDGEDPEGWIFLCEQYFEYHNIPVDRQVRLSSFHLTGEALSWFRHENKSTPFPNWETLVTATISRFSLKPFAGAYGSFSRVQ